MPPIPSSAPDRVALAASLAVLAFAVVTAGIGAWERLEARRTVEVSCDPAERRAVVVADTAEPSDYVCADLRGLELTGRDLSFFSFEASDLTGARLEGALLVETDLINAILVDVQMRSVFAPHADFEGAVLAGADAARASLVGSSFRDVDAAGVDLSAADLTGVDFTRANLAGARLTGAILEGVRWAGTTCPDGTNSDAAPAGCADHLDGSEAVAASR